MPSSIGFVSPLAPSAFAPVRPTSSHISTAFTGRPVINHAVLARPSRPTRHITPTMKKGRFQRPMQPKQQPGMTLPEDGTPVFAIFVRTQRAKIWYPLGAVQGDNRSKDLVNALKNGGFAQGMYENALDKGIAQTLYGRDKDRFNQNAVRMYPQLKKYVRELQFGYRVAAVGLDEQPTKLVTKEMTMNFWQWAKKKVDDKVKDVTG